MSNPQSVEPETEITMPIMPSVSASPKRQRTDALLAKNPRSYARKRARIEVQSWSPGSGVHQPEPGELHGTDLMEATASTSHTQISAQTDPPARSSESAPPLPPSAPGLLDNIEHEAHTNRLALQRSLDRGKGTEEAYPRHIKNYEEFWERDQDRRAEEDPNHVRVPAHPIIAIKVNIFLTYERTRPKRNRRGLDIPGTTVGKESIKQSINALQRYMLENQHLPEYKNCPETQKLLRDQDLVKMFEHAACAQEPQRVREAHILKSKGTSSDGYTTEDLIKMSVWAMQSFGPSRLQTHIGLRDRAMVMLSTSVAFRGNSSRLALLSDLFFRSIPMDVIGQNVKLQALGILADQSKTNVTGRTEENGIFRHRIPELCGFGGMGFYLFSHFHILERKPPPFAPDFDDPDHQEFGRRDWYNHFLFPGKGSEPDGMNPMTYDNHYERVNLMHKRNDVKISAVTHAGRGYTATKAREHGAAAIDTKQLGRWKTGDAYSEIYDRGLPPMAMLASAMFNTLNPPSYVLPRGILEPPSDLCDMIFPWIEDEFEAYKQRAEEYGSKATDYALKNFLTLLVQFRTILLQDAAVLYIKYPDFHIWSYAPFNLPAFVQFAQSSQSILTHAEISARQRLKELPETLSMSMQGILQTIYIEQRKERNEVTQRLQYLEGLMRGQLTSSAKGRKVVEALNQVSDLLPGNRSRAVTTTNERVAALVNGASGESPDPNRSSTVPDTSDPQHVSSLSLSTDQYALPDDLKILQSNIRLSSTEEERLRQISLIQTLVKKYGLERVSKHQFEWMRYSTGLIREEWLPYYTYRKGISLRQIWEEWAEGLDGCLSVRQLTEAWEARWRRNVQGQKTEASRRKHIIELVRKLSEKTNWSVRLALQFLEDEYRIPGPGFLASPTSFAKELQNKVKGAQLVNDIMEKSNSYCKK